MKKNNGVTMISLVLTVIVLLILSSITVRVSTESYNVMKVQNFIAKMRVIQSKVDSIAEENNTDVYDIKLETLEKEDKTTFERFKSIIDKIREDPEMGNTSWMTGGDGDGLDNDIGGYYYFTEKDLEQKLGLKDLHMTVIINPKTRNIISKTGVKLYGKTYYRQYDLPSGEQLN